MNDNYVTKKRYTGLTEGAGGQVELTTEEVTEGELVTTKAENKSARKNGGGVDSDAAKAK